jgi:hypothetical protein
MAGKPHMGQTGKNSSTITDYLRTLHPEPCRIGNRTTAAPIEAGRFYYA